MANGADVRAIRWVVGALRWIGVASVALVAAGAVFWLMVEPLGLGDDFAAQVTATVFCLSASGAYVLTQALIDNLELRRYLKGHHARQSAGTAPSTDANACRPVRPG
jgi:hypothetical protein